MAKRYTFVLVDDEAKPNHGYDRFIALLQVKGYLRKGPIYLDLNSRKGWNDDPNQPIDFRVMSSNFRDNRPGGGGVGFRFCEALETFEKEKALFDFFVFDLNYDDNRMDPTYIPSATNKRVNLCEESEKYRQRKLSVEDSTESNKSSFVAGLSFLLRTPLDDRIKIIYSAAQQTENLRRFIKLFSSRLKDVFVLDVDQVDFSRVAEDLYLTDPDLNETLDALDAYFRSRQIVTIERQSIDDRLTLESYLNASPGQLPDRLTEPSIPHDGTENAKSEQHDCWSLHTLFPKQVNLLLDPSSDDGKEKSAKTYIVDILQLNLRRLIWWALWNHVKPPDTPSSGEKFKKYVAALKNLDFPNIDDIDADLSSYKKLSSFESCVDKDTNGNEIEDKAPWPDSPMLRIHDLHYDVRETFKLLSNSFGVTISNVLVSSTSGPSIMAPEDFIAKAAEYGVYAIDILYIYHVAKLNGNSCDSKDRCDFSVAYHSNKIELLYLFQQSTNWLNDNRIDTAINAIMKGAKRSLRSSQDKLFTEGVEDVITLVCKRYKGVFEFWAGSKSLVITREDKDTGGTIIAIEDRGQVAYKITIEGHVSQNFLRRVR